MDEQPLRVRLCDGGLGCQILRDADRVRIVPDACNVPHLILEQLYERQARHTAQLLQIARVERLDKYRTGRGIETRQSLEDGSLLCEPDRREMRRVLGLRVPPDLELAAAPLVRVACELHDLIERG